MKCEYLFCGCQSISSSPYDPDTFKALSVSTLFSIIYILIITMLIIKMNLSWFIYKDYYPLKQRSPILCQLLIAVIGIQLVFYPTLYVINYLTLNFTNLHVKIIFRAVNTSFQFTPYIIYLLRALRIVYAHQCQRSNSKNTHIFKIFKNQALLAVMIFAISLLRSIPIIIDGYTNYTDSPFKLIVEYSAPQIESSQEQVFLYRYFLSSFLWKIILIYCLYLQKKVHPRYSMRDQLILIIITEILTSIPIILIGFSQNGQIFGVMKAMCFVWDEKFPVSQLIQILKLLMFLLISIILPLRQKKLYHRLLPTGRVYGFVKTMRDFLLETQFLKIFQKYLQYLDYQQQTTKNSSLLIFWKKLIVLKYKQQPQELQKIQQMEQLINQYQFCFLLDESVGFIAILRESIEKLKISLINHSEILTQQKDYRMQINQKVDQLQKLVLVKLDKIYIRKYIHTSSYYQLRERTMNNKRVNLNMIMLNMALIVDSEGQYE